jgi:hypothetical protein
MTLAFFAAPLPGELLYSALARNGVLRGLDSPKAVMGELFGRPSTIATVDLPNSLALLLGRVPGWTARADDVIGQHTLFRYYTAFQPRERRGAARKAMLGESGSLHFMLGVSTFRTGRPSHLQFCPLCLDEAATDHGFLHWRVAHQLPGVLVCADHGSRLRRSMVRPASLNRHAYVPASRDVCPADCEALTPILRGRTLDLALALSKASSAMVARAAPARTREDIRDGYRRRLADLGFVRGRHKVQQTRLEEAFRDYFGDLLDRLEGLDLSAGSETWLNSIVRSCSSAHPPLQHLLLQMFLDAYSAPVIGAQGGVMGPATPDRVEENGTAGCVATDWRRIDRDYSIAIRQRAHMLKRVSPPVRVTAASIERGLKGRDWLAKRRAKLPVSDSAIKDVAEDIEGFRMRRMRWHVRACLSEGNFDPWIVMRRAGLPPDYIDAVRAEFDFEVSPPVPLARAA